nr:retrovirus-related Pol polyprotein from transposon TNT 1-94 [Tanacetum cinerariifolium]
MTTSSTNNLVFRGFFEKQKLNGPNFIDWYRQLKIVLSIEDKLYYLKQPIPSAPVAPEGRQVDPEILEAHNAWIKGSKEIAGLMLMIMDLKIQQNLEPLHAHEMLKEQEEGQSVSSYVLKMKGYINNLKRLGHPVTLGLGILNELHAMLKLHEKTLPKRNAHALHAIRAVFSRVNEEEKERGLGIFVIELNTILNRSWIYDTGCGTHICNTTEGLRASRKLKPGALSLYVGNGQREAVEAIVAFYLCLLSGLEIVLNNCHYAPSITRGVISWIYEIDLSNSLTNESSIYDVGNKRAKLDLDSALLCHCRLGHISKKHIKKLQHDGLLDSSDLRAFENVSLVSLERWQENLTHIRIVLSIEDKLYYLKQPIPSAPVAPEGRQVDPEILEAHNAWIKGSKEISGLMLMIMDLKIQQNLEPLHAHEMLKRQSVSSYVLKMKGYINNLKRLGHPVTLGLGVHEKTLPKINAHALHAIRAGKVQKGKTLEEELSSVFSRVNEEEKERGLGIFVIELNTILNRSWIYDTGCGTHICNTTEGLRASRKLKPGALSLYVGNGQREVVEAIVAFYFCLLSGLEIVLNNCHYAPSITRGVISVSRFNKRAKLDLDSALLCHCRLGYISKKRIKKLQHDGLLDSSDLRAFENVSLVEKTPYEVWHGKAPKLSYLKVWGCEALVKQDTLTKSDKLELRSIKCIFVGYPKEIMGYSFYYPPDNKVHVARNAEFLENSLIDQEVSRSLEDLKIIQEEDKHPSLDTSLNYEQDDLEIDEPQSDIAPIRRSTRTRHASDHMCLYIDAEEYELGDLSEPANYKPALLDLEFEKWLNAMNVEMQSMKDNEVWVLVELSPNGKTIGSKWLFKKKTDMDGNVHIYKARLVAKGYTQTPGIDYEETFSPVTDIRAIRILIAIATYYDYEIWQMDVKTAFFNGYLNEEVYMEQHEGFVNPKGDQKRELRVSCYIDAGYLTDVDDLKSRTGYVFILNGGVVDWKSAKKSIFATSSAEAEYIAAFDAFKEAVWVRKFISWLGVVPIIEKPISMYCDNTGGIAIANES